MRILFLNLYFPPDTSATAKSAESMVHALARTHEVTVLCGRPSYEPTERRPWKLWRTERIGSTTPQSTGEGAAQITGGSNAFNTFSGSTPASQPQDYAQGFRNFVIHDPDGYNLVLFKRLKARSPAE